MHILITGATGMVGRHLVPLLRGQGFAVSTLTSSHSKQNVKQNVFFWDPEREIFPRELTLAPDIVIHLAGANLSSQRWSDTYKQEIVKSRVETSGFLLQQMLNKGWLPKKYISASGTDYYPNPGHRAYSESDQPGGGFLSAVCIQWEDAASEWSVAGVMTSILRTPVVLASGEGFMKAMMQTAGFGIIPTTGSPGNTLSWIHVDDLCRIYLRAVQDDMPGTWNVAAPETTTMGELVKSIDRARRIKTLHPNVPAWALKLMLGEMGSLACTNQAVSSQKLLDAGFRFLYPNIQHALEHIFRR